MTTELQNQDPATFDLSHLDEEQDARARALSRNINLEDTQSIIQYGVGAQSNISKFADTILQEVSSKDAGQTGELLTSLVLNVKELNVGELGDEENFWEKLPLIGSLMDRAKRFIARYEKLSVQIESIVDNLDKARMGLLKDLSMLDMLHQKNLEYLRELDVFIAAGHLKLAEIREQVLPGLRTKAEESKDPIDSQRYQDMEQFVNRFEKKLHDLKLSRMVSIQTQPQIRLIQNNNQLLVEKIQSSILNTVPLWKNQVVIAISLMRQKKALELQREVTDTTNELLQKNSEMMRQSSVEAAREGERGIVELETLKKVNQDLIATLEETIKIQAEGRSRRQQAEQELVRLEEELRNKLLNNQSVFSPSSS